MVSGRRFDYRLWSYERGTLGVLRHDAPQPYAIWAASSVMQEGSTESSRTVQSSSCVFRKHCRVFGPVFAVGHSSRILYLINHGFGANWTDFEGGKRLYAQTVASHPQGLPLYLAGRSFRQATIQQTTESRRSFWSRLYPGEPLGEVWPDGFLLWKRREYSQTRRSRMEARYEKPDDELPV